MFNILHQQLQSASCLAYKVVDTSDTITQRYDSANLSRESILLKAGETRFGIARSTGLL